MKKIIFSLLAIGMMAGMTTKVSAQAVTDTESNTANAQILGAINLSVGTNLEFGGIVPDGSSSGTVLISPDDDSRTLTTVTGVSVSTTPKAASYTVTGTGLAPYTVTIPTASFDITNTTGSGAETMAVTSMTISGGSLSKTFAGDGTSSFKVGGTLTVGAAQEPGVYSGSFNVTVAY